MEMTGICETQRGGAESGKYDQSTSYGCIKLFYKINKNIETKVVFSSGRQWFVQQPQVEFFLET